MLVVTDPFSVPLCAASDKEIIDSIKVKLNFDMELIVRIVLTAVQKKPHNFQFTCKMRKRVLRNQ